jgi:hypothetical protein
LLRLGRQTVNWNLKGAENMVTVASSEALAVLETSMRRGQRHFTLTEAAAMTGLAIDDARDALEALLDRYVCRLQVSENGDLIYHFGDTLRRRGAKTIAERWQEITAWLWNVFTVIYKAWIAVTLVVYFVIFLVILIALLIAASSRQSDRDRRSPASALDMNRLFHMFFAIFHWRTITGTIDYQRDRHGYRYRHYQPQPGVLKADKKSFIAAVYDFVFGPPRVVLDPLTNEKEVAAYLQQNKGIVVPAELIALAGWDFPQAETFLTDCVIRFYGEPKVSDNAVLYGEFDTITRGVGQVESGEIVHYWDEYEPEYELTGNSSTYNLGIALMNSFNLILSFLVLRGMLSGLEGLGPGTQLGAFLMSYQGVIELFLGWLPLIFSSLFFLIPLGRLAKIQALQRQRQFQNIRKRLYKVIFARQGQPQTVRELVSAINTHASEETLSRQVVEDRIKELALDLAGDMTVTETAEVQFTFPRIARELHEAAQLRRQRRLDNALGEIIAEEDNQDV